MIQRNIGPFTVNAIGLGCMGLSHGYGASASHAQATAVLLDALEQGVDFFDTAPLYGNGENEALVGQVLSAHRNRFVLATKCGLNHPASGAQRRIDGRPEAIRASCEASLTRLQTDVIDLLYLHRWDKQVPIEESVGAMADLVREGKVRALGLSEVSAGTLRRAHAEHPIAAVQSEYSLWTRNPEIAVADACLELGVAFVAFSPLGRGYLTTRLIDTSRLDESDIRRSMPRFDVLNYAANLRLLDRYVPLVQEAGCTAAQLALAWLLHKAPHVVPLPGTSNLAHLHENMLAVQTPIGPDLMKKLDSLFRPDNVCGPRYNATQMQEVDTENFDS
jgi:aryl-alcohol dehydrogenase-like predicted oxidoreductase